MKFKLRERKRKHLEICLNRNQPIESGSTEFSLIQLPHKAFPKTSHPSLKTDFLGYTLQSPIMISCMTGGTGRGKHLNQILAQAANEKGIAVGTGSIRVMLSHPETKSHFNLKKFAPNVPLIANIGASQLLSIAPEKILDGVAEIEADGLYVHLNAAQELFQPEGDKTFQGWFEAIQKLIEHAKIPILVKETGCGIPPVEGIKLLRNGAACIDVAGMGGTDWIAVERLCQNTNRQSAADSFNGWGYSTASLLLAYRHSRLANKDMENLLKKRLVASGGLRTPKDFAVALSCGAHIVAAALPFIRAAVEGGTKTLCTYISTIEEGIQAAIILTGSESLDRLRQCPITVEPALEKRAILLAEEAIGKKDAL